ncbi:hypothetical protein ACGC1H_001101 [Rhizoctonia solani]|uniref:F-box domain-containing protein n=1 Tax=Rhizoctonia solani TaxID=456999 RepID=A0A8H3B5X6_9AGAM|nr:unnamed protein product [Rhizoctonia solani]
MKGKSAAAPPRKRQRTQKQPAQRKRGQLADFMNLPTDVFNLIASHLLPIDILSLARSNKFFRSLLMTKSSRVTWLNAMKNVEGLPSCPSNVSEPGYVALLFTNVCSLCGILSRSQVDEFLLVRLCAACKRSELMKFHEIPEELHELVDYSAKAFIEDIPEIRRLVGVAIRDEVYMVWKKYNELAKAGDKKAFKSWVAQRKQRTASRREWAGELAKFFDTIEKKRAEEKEELVRTREAQIKEKLLALGWEAGDLEFHPYADGIQQWHELVEMPKQPRPLTDRVWKNLYNQLKPILEVNCEQRLEGERSKRHSDRRDRLETFLYRVKRKEPLLLKVKPRQSGPATHRWMSRPVAQRDVFPFVQDALELPFIQAMNEEDLSVEAFKQGLEEHQGEIEKFIAEWRDQTRTYLVDLIQEEDMEYAELLQPPRNMDSDAFARLSDDQKLLLRADSLFYVDEPYSNPSVKRVYNYEMALRTAYPMSPEYPAEPWELECESDYESDSPDLDIIHRHAAAQEVARDLLEDLGKSNASWVEVDQLKYSCERCHDRIPMEWTKMIEHYLKHKQIWARVEKHASVLVQQGITYNNVHDPAFYNNKPLIRPCKRTNSSSVMGPVRKCRLCVHKLISQDVILSPPKLDKHLLKVHGFSRPKLDVHYHVPSGTFGLPPGHGYEHEEPEEDNEEVEADNAPDPEVAQ